MMGIVEKLKSKIIKTRNFTQKIRYIFADKKEITEELFEDLLSTLVQGDINIKMSENIINNLRNKVKENLITDSREIEILLKEELINILNKNYHPFNLSEENLQVILVVGVNGSGKTTSVIKLANNLKSKGKKVLLAAADTFRAAAIDQLEAWAKKIEVDIVKHKESSDAAAVVYDALQAARARKVNILIVDTAGRLHTKSNLMEELKKIKRIITKNVEEKYIETLLVLDATVGQNGLVQAKLFKDAVGLTGIILAKLDGTAKGGIVITVSEELSLPVKFIGVGEDRDDILEFVPENFVQALFD